MVNFQLFQFSLTLVIFLTVPDLSFVSTADNMDQWKPELVLPILQQLALSRGYCDPTQPEQQKYMELCGDVCGDPMTCRKNQTTSTLFCKCEPFDTKSKGCGNAPEGISPVEEGKCTDKCPQVPSSKPPTMMTSYYCKSSGKFVCVCAPPTPQAPPQ